MIVLLELNRDDIKHIRTALAYMLIQHHDMVETGTLVTHRDVDHLIEAAQDAAEFQEKLRVTLAKLPAE